MKQTLFILAVALVGLSACKKKDKVYTLGTSTVTVDNAAYRPEPQNMSLKRADSTSVLEMTLNELGVQKSILIMARHTYKAGMSTGQTDSSYATYSETSGTDTLGWSTGQINPPLQFTITSLDETKRLASGTFTYTAKSFGNNMPSNTKLITGTFTNIQVRLN